MTRFLVASVILAVPCLSPLAAAQVTLEQDDQGVTVRCDGQMFTRYWKKSGAKPILWPIVGPTGKEMTRGYPMREATDTEKKDHVHHRSVWFVHGDVNGISFWDESGRNGTIEHHEYLRLEGGSPAVIQTRNEWRSPTGDPVCEDLRTMKFGVHDEFRWIDFQVKVTAGDGRVVFGDTKEGSFGVRVADTMSVDRKLGGRIVNSESQIDGDAWGKPASWVDYSGPVDGEMVGLAILNHPRSLRYPTHWHVRTYGLFAANPFGLRDFSGSDTDNGSLTLEPGESFEIFLRLILHRGNWDPARINELFKTYAAEAVGQ